MKAISLHQPYASLIAAGLKKVETRSWPTTHRGWLAIHAAKAWRIEQRAAMRRIAEMQPRLFGELFDPHEMPLGAIVAVARLVDCRRMDEAWILEQREIELDVGGWEVGRYGWVLEDVRPVRPAVALCGRQGLFEVDPRALPYEVVTQLGEVLAGVTSEASRA